MKTRDILRPYQLLHGRWSVRKKLGSGSYGQIYAAVHTITKQWAALKVAWIKSGPESILWDVTFLKALQGQDHVCQFLGFGSTDSFRLLAMTFQGKNLATMQSEQPQGRFSLCTALQLGRQMLRAVESVHAVGFVHRDIKPANFVMGRDDNRRTVYIIDFGLGRRYLTPSRELKPARESPGFVGTPYYASVNVLRHKEAGRHDDLWSLLYTLVKFLVGRLPWEGIKCNNFTLAMKEEYQLAEDMPVEVKSFLEHLQTLDYNTAPNYHFLRLLLENCMWHNDIRDSDPYDWEKSHGDTSVTTTKASPLPGDCGGLGPLDDCLNDLMQEMKVAENSNSNQEETETTEYPSTISSMPSLLSGADCDNLLTPFS